MTYPANYNAMDIAIQNKYGHIRYCISVMEVTGEGVCCALVVDGVQEVISPSYETMIDAYNALKDFVVNSSVPA